MPLNASHIFPSSNPEFVHFPSRRSVVHSTNGIVSSTQPLACAAGQRILRQGGNAADAAVAVAAALNLTEPCSTGIGGDMFCLFYEAKTKKVHSLNGSGRSPANISLEKMQAEFGLKEDEGGHIPMLSPHAVTVPGAPAGWVDTIEKFGSGKLTLEQILTPAIEMGEQGFPVSELTGKYWTSAEPELRKASPNFAEMLKKDSNAPDGFRAPRPGDIMKNPTLARTFRALAAEGKKGFYEGRIAEAIVKVHNDLGGYLTLEDLKHHAETGTQETKAISLKFDPKLLSSDIDQSQGQDGASAMEEVEVWEHPPNGQGIVALMALGILESLAKEGKMPKYSEKDHNSAAYLHAVIEALRIAFADANWFVTDPDVQKVPSEEMISKSYLAERAKLFNPDQASNVVDHGSPALNSSDTVYFAVSDSEGNGMSFINSNYAGFGSCIIPAGCGFTLQNRGSNFDLLTGHPNALEPRKRPYHTIIPAMITNPKDNSLFAVYGIMGGFNQPQAHVQVLLNMTLFKHNPQAAIDAPRICIGAGTPDIGEVLDLTVYVEEGIKPDVVEELKRLGHKVVVLEGFKRGMFGRGQIIRWHEDDGQGVWSAGSDPRGDGMAVPV